MDRRKFLLSCALAMPSAFLFNKIGGSRLMTGKVRSGKFNKTDDDQFKRFADLSLSTSAKNDASYADFRLSIFRSQQISAREENVQSISDEEDFGFSVRVIVNGAWGFAASSTFTESEVLRVSRIACEIAKANSIIQKKPVELVPVPVYQDFWRTPIKKDPFEVSEDEKVNLLLSINQKAKSLGADYCSSFIWAVNEWKYFASSEGSYIKQDLYRIWPVFDITVIDKSTGKFESRESLSAPIGKGYEYIEEYDFFADLEKAVEETKMMHTAKSVEPGKKDIILDPTHLWLTIHETCGHPSELDRSLGYEANYAGTSFMTPDKLGKLKYGSDIVNLNADRTQANGLATRGYDDEGVRTTQWPIVKNGLFTGFQTTREMAGFIGQDNSNGCAYADSWSHFPIQRMPNISLEPGTKKLSLKDLIAGTDNGIYIVGDGSWSIDMQRYNFQFTGKAFYEIKGGKITGILRDVAYQGNTVDFWNSCDAICDASEYKLGGSMFCGKGEPGQVSPVSHGSSPARFRKVNIINTNSEHSG